VVTEHKHPVVELIPFRRPDTDRIRAAIDSLKEFQRTHSLKGLSVRQMVEEGRRY
jgi:antitoxin (DNA-binding transcriptional repressor) of toxin-antitoxin stability system